MPFDTNRDVAEMSGLPRLPPCTVLVVDDDASVRAVLTMVLADAGMTVIEAECANAALDVLAARPDIAVLVTDVRMPGMSGLDLRRVALRQNPALRVVVVSGHIMAEPCGVTVLPKPFRSAELIRAVAMALTA